MINFCTLDELESLVGLPVPTGRDQRALWCKVAEKICTERYGEGVWLATCYFGPEIIGTILDEVQTDWQEHLVEEPS